jgi:CO/xanthine dehydrogenase Mo-binding subunit
MTVWTTSQNPHPIRLLLSAFTLGIPEHKLRVISPDVGGGFGSKIFHYPEEIITPWVARAINRPTKWVATRSESCMTDSQGRDHVTVAKLALKKDGKPVTYQAPKEGAIAWLDGLSLVKGAKNVDQVYAFLEYLQTPEVSAKVAEGSSYNPVVIGADALTSDVYKKNFQEAYPGDSLKNLWHRIPEPAWFGDLRGQYADKFKSA